ncbi:hypothetical protein [Thalassoglobus neptunius]|nr:hypothetical protein [Thalassoglobus neptunius]
MLDEEPCRTFVEYERNGGRQAFELSITPIQGRLQLEADWPSGLRPIGILLAQFELDQASVAFSEEIELPEESVQAAQPNRDADVGLAERFTAVLESAQGPKTLGDDTHFFAERVGLNLIVKGELADGCDEEVVMTELDYVSIANKRAKTYCPVALKWNSSLNRGYKEVQDYPWPKDARDNSVQITVRSLTKNDLPSLPGSMVSTLLSAERKFVPVPIRPDPSGAFSARFCFSSQRDFASDPETTWLMQMAEEGGAA